MERSLLLFFHRSCIFLDLQRVHHICAAGDPPFHLTGDGEPLHRQSGAFRRRQLHLCGDQHRDKDQGPGPFHPAGAPQRR